MRDADEAVAVGAEDPAVTTTSEPKARSGRDPESIAYDHSALQASQYDTVDTGDRKHRSIETDSTSEDSDIASEQNNTEV